MQTAARGPHRIARARNVCCEVPGVSAWVTRPAWRTVEPAADYEPWTNHAPWDSESALGYVGTTTAVTVCAVRPVAIPDPI